MERYRELETDEFYANKNKKGETSIDFRMLNEASEVALKSDKRWKDLGFIYNKMHEIEKELKKEMNARDRRETKKILDRYASRHAVLLHTRASKEEVIVNEVKIDFDYNLDQDQTDESESLIKKSKENSQDSIGKKNTQKCIKGDR